MTSKILAASVLALIFTGCTNSGSSSSTPSGGHLSTSGAAHAAGDLVPGRLVPVSIPAPTDFANLHNSAALAPRKSYSFETPNQPTVGRDVHLVMTGDPSTFVVPVDTPQGARVIVHPLDPNVELRTAHLVDVATGNRLDLARDDSDVIPNVKFNKAGAPGTTIGGAIHPAEGPQLTPSTGALTREPGFEPLVLHTRVLSFDRPYQGGIVRVEVPASVAAGGIFVEVQQPNSHITLTAAADEVNHAFGDTVEVTATLQSDSTPLTGRVDGTIELPDHTKLPMASFSSVGGGKYVGKIPLTDTEPKYVGVWGIRLHVTGVVDGVSFERDAETAFGYHPAHAMLTAIGAPVIARGSDGLIDSISFDTDIQTLADDRFSVKGTLTYTAADGQEHPLAVAQTGQVIKAGTGTITLIFDAAALALARVDGPFHLRDVSLVSQGYGIVQHRLGRALDIVTPAIKAAEIRYPKEIPLQAQDLIANGDLDK